jgi:hypothetical protein
MRVGGLGTIFSIFLIINFGEPGRVRWKNQQSSPRKNFGVTLSAPPQKRTKHVGVADHLRARNRNSHQTQTGGQEGFGRAGRITSVNRFTLG